MAKDKLEVAPHLVQRGGATQLETRVLSVPFLRILDKVTSIGSIDNLCTCNKGIA